MVETCEVCGRRVNLFDIIIWNRHDKCSEEIMEKMLEEKCVLTRQGVKDE